MVAADRVLLVGLGRERDFNEAAYRTALAAATRALRSTGASEATICLTDLALKRRARVAWLLDVGLGPVQTFGFTSLTRVTPGASSAASAPSGR